MGTNGEKKLDEKLLRKTPRTRIEQFIFQHKAIFVTLTFFQQKKRKKNFFTHYLLCVCIIYRRLLL